MDYIKKIDRPRSFEILDNAFSQSYGMTWMLRNKDSIRSKKWIIRLMYLEAKSKNGAYITNDKNGVVLFFSIQDKRLSIRYKLGIICFILFVTGIKNGIRALKYQRLVASIRPKKGMLGLLVATDQNIAGSKAAYQIKQEMFRIADEKNENIFLETTIPRVRALYLAVGYVEYAEMKHPYVDLVIWFFKREPSQK